MSQFASTYHANQTVREAFEDYRSDENRIKEIENKIKNGKQLEKLLKIIVQMRTELKRLKTKSKMVK